LKQNVQMSNEASETLLQRLRLAEKIHDELRQNLQQEQDLNVELRNRWTRASQQLQEEHTMRKANKSLYQSEIQKEFLLRMIQIQKRNASVKAENAKAKKTQEALERKISTLQHDLFEVRRELYMANQMLRSSGVKVTGSHDDRKRSIDRGLPGQSIPAEPTFDHHRYLHLFSRYASWRNKQLERIEAGVMRGATYVWDQSSKVRHHIRPTVGLIAQIGNAVIEELSLAWTQFVTHPKVSPWASPVLEVVNDFVATSRSFITSTFLVVQSHHFYHTVCHWVAGIPHRISDAQLRLVNGQRILVNGFGVAVRTIYLYFLLERWPHYTTAAAYFVYHYHESVTLFLEAIMTMWLLTRILQPLWKKIRRPRKNVSFNHGKLSSA
jgi:hypothetical protein